MPITLAQESTPTRVIQRRKRFPPIRLTLDPKLKRYQQKWLKNSVTCIYKLGKLSTKVTQKQCYMYILTWEIVTSEKGTWYTLQTSEEKGVVICVWRTLYIVNIHCAGLPHCARHTVYHTTHTTQIGSVWLRYPCEVGQEHNMAQLGKRPVIICGQWTTVCNDNCEAEKLVEKLCGQLATCTKTRAHIW